MRSGADLNGDNLRISTAYLRISDHCTVTVRNRVWVMVRVRIKIKVRVRVRFNVANCCIQTAGEGDKSGSMMWLKLTNGDAPCRSPPLRILSCPCQGKVRVIDGQCLQTNKQSHIVLQLYRGGSKTSTGDAQLTIWLVNCAYCNGTSSNLSSYSYLSVCCSQLILPLFSVEVWCLRWHSDRSALIRN